MKVLRDNGLTIVLLGAFAFSLAGMLLSGLAQENGMRAVHGEPALTLGAYVLSGSFLSALFENWESEFLQMSAYVVLTAILFQRGSAESRDPDDPFRPGDEVTPHRRAASRIGEWLYDHGLGLVLALLFVLSFVLHWLSSAEARNEEALAHGQPVASLLSHLGDPTFWFESFQNWQSEFLSTAVLVVLSIFLRHRGSPESKPLAASNSNTGA
jgi:membrane protein implicated in regulation of membrane protease activity